MHRSKSADEFSGQYFDYIITICDNAKESCPVFPYKETRIHQSFEDLTAESVGDYESRIEIFRRVRSELCQIFRGRPPLRKSIDSSFSDALSCIPGKTWLYVSKIILTSASGSTEKRD